MTNTAVTPAGDSGAVSFCTIPLKRGISTDGTATAEVLATARPVGMHDQEKGGVMEETGPREIRRDSGLFSKNKHPSGEY